MKHLLCASVSRVLEAYHDGELPVEEQIVVEAHLTECYVCASEARSLRLLQAGLREDSGAEATLQPRGSLELQFASMRTAVVSRTKAERDQSWPSRVGRLFEDLHLVWAALAATSATATCAAVVAGVLYFAPRERSDSLAAVMAALAAPGSDRNPMLVDKTIALPRFEAEPVIQNMPLTTEGTDVMLTVSGVVTRDGRVTFPSLLSTSPYTQAEDLQMISQVSATRFEPAMRAGAPVAVNLVWLLERTTVRPLGGKSSS
jgi:hypothetical protein